MSIGNKILNAFLGQAHNPIKNYVVPGLTSSLISRSEKGVVRLFESSRQQVEFVTPHSHRYNFRAFVLEGWVKNILYSREGANQHSIPDLFQVSKLSGTLGNYKQDLLDQHTFFSKESSHIAGEPSDTYSMLVNQIHSIYFSKGAKVLVFEDPEVSDHDLILEPVVEGIHIPTFEVKPWMFSK